MVAPRKEEVRKVYGYRTTENIGRLVAEAAFAADDITQSKWVEIAIKEKLRRDGFLPAKNPPERSGASPL